MKISIGLLIATAVWLTLGFLAVAWAGGLWGLLFGACCVCGVVSYWVEEEKRQLRRRAQR